MYKKFHLAFLRCAGSFFSLIAFLRKEPKEQFHPFGFGTFTQFIGYFFSSEDEFTINIGANKKSTFSFLLKDAYWSPLILPWKEYEPEIRYVLSQILKPGDVFLDCGANLGYWSTYASSILIPEDVVAIEAFRNTFSQLQKNARRNFNFQCIFGALSDQDDQKVWISGQNHAGMRITEFEDHSFGEWTNSITLDTIYEKYVRRKSGKIIIKLDIEGAEIQALQGAKSLLTRNPILIYEDHGKDRESKVSRFIVEELNYLIFIWEKGCGLQEIHLDNLPEVKKINKIGYNFIAMPAR